MEENNIQFADFLLAYAKTRPSISPETIQVEAQTLYTRLLDNLTALKECYHHFISRGKKTKEPGSKKRKRVKDNTSKQRKKQKKNDDVVDLTVEPKRHVTRSSAHRRKTRTGDSNATKKRSSKIAGVLPKGSAEWYGVVQYRKGPGGALKEKRTDVCKTESEVVSKISYILKKIQIKGYTLHREDYGQLIAPGRKQVMTIAEMKVRRSQRKKKHAEAQANDIITIQTEFPKTSKYEGVTWDPKVDRWLAFIRTRTPSKRIIRGGYFTNVVKAGKCVNELCARNGMSPLNPSLCVDGTVRKVVYGKQSKYVGIVYSPADDQWNCDLKYRKPDSHQILLANDGHGLWDSDEEELVKRVKADVLKLEHQGMITVDFEYGTTKLNRAPDSKYIGLEFDIDHGRWACWIQYKQSHSAVTSTKLLGYEKDQHKLAQSAREWVRKKKEDPKIEWVFIEEYGVSKLDREKRNRAMRETDTSRGDKDLYEVERIIEWKITKEGRKYHVKWASAEDEYTWEPEEHVLHLELFKEFHKRNIERIQQQRDLELQRQQISPSHTFPSDNYKGVTFDTRDCKWHASYTVGGKTHHGGALDSELDAAVAVNTLCRKANRPVLNRGIEKVVRQQLYSTRSHKKAESDNPESIYWIRTNGHVYFPTDRERRFLRPECQGDMPPLEFDAPVVG